MHIVLPRDLFEERIKTVGFNELGSAILVYVAFSQNNIYFTKKLSVAVAYHVVI